MKSSPLEYSSGVDTLLLMADLVALNDLVALHYEKRHLMDIIRRQGEEIDHTRNKTRDTGTLVNHLTEVKDTHEGRLADLTTNRDENRNMNIKVSQNRFFDLAIIRALDGLVLFPYILSSNVNC